VFSDRGAGRGIGWVKTTRGTPKITGFAKAPTLSADERTFCSHEKGGEKFVIYRVRRSQAQGLQEWNRQEYLFHQSRPRVMGQFETGPLPDSDDALTWYGLHT
jgi:hypothetical protein